MQEEISQGHKEDKERDVGTIEDTQGEKLSGYERIYKRD